ncbi:hypothetical protein C3L29_038470, partial [Pseudomonas sp. MWU12-2534b]
MKRSIVGRPLWAAGVIAAGAALVQVVSPVTGAPLATVEGAGAEAVEQALRAGGRWVEGQGWESPRKTHPRRARGFLVPGGCAAR